MPDINNSPAPCPAINLKCCFPRNLILGIVLTSMVILTPFANLRLNRVEPTLTVVRNNTTRNDIYASVLRMNQYSGPPAESVLQVKPGLYTKTGLPAVSRRYPAGNTKFGVLPCTVVDLLAPDSVTAPGL